jgi:hypothetical protein
VFDVSRKSVLEAELVHDFLFRRFQLSWAAIFDCEHVPTRSVGWHTLLLLNVYTFILHRTF